MSNLKRLTLDTLESHNFYQFPKFLMADKFAKLSNDAKMLYMIIRSRHTLSATNNWVNRGGEIYIIFTRAQMAEALHLSKNTITKLCGQLKQYNLIDEQTQGKNQPNVIYLFSYVDNAITKPKRERKNPTHRQPFFSPQDTQILRPINNNKNNNDTLYLIKQKNNINKIEQLHKSINQNTTLSQNKKHYITALINIINRYLSQSDDKNIYINRQPINSEEFKMHLFSLTADNLITLTQNIDTIPNKYKQAYITTVLYNFCYRIRDNSTLKIAKNTTDQKGGNLYQFSGKTHYNQQPSYKIADLYNLVD